VGAAGFFSLEQSGWILKLTVNSPSSMHCGFGAHPDSIQWISRDYFPGTKRLDPEAHRQLTI